MICKHVTAYIGDPVHCISRPTRGGFCARHQPVESRRARDIRDASERIAGAFRNLIRAQQACDARTDARAALPAGSSRAKVTTVNARWMRACEQRDLCEQVLRDLGVDLSVAMRP